MNRILVSSSAAGPSNFTFQINPYIYEAQDESYVSELEIIHGPPAYQEAYFDGRKRFLIWQNVEVSNQNISNIVSYFRSIKGKIRYFNFQDLDDINEGWPSSSTWKKARIVNLKVKYAPGGKLKFETIQLEIQPEP